MKAHLIYNPNAARTGRIAPQEILEILLSLDFDPIYRPTVEEEHLDRVLEEIEGLVIIAGGDGSVRAVVRRLLDRPVQLTILPLGTANNIAQTLGIEGAPRDLLAGLADHHTRSFDVGRVQLPDREVCFLEGAGCGLFGNAFAAFHKPDGYGRQTDEKSITRSFEAVLTALDMEETFNLHVTVDGEAFEGELLALEVLNTPVIGPGLKLSMEANPGDRLLDVVRIRPGARDEMWEYLQNLLAREVGELPSVEVTQGKKVQLRWTGLPLHADTRVYAVEKGREISATFDLYPQPMEIWIPQTSQESV
jgi:diacylglycerol kinase family enzyme